MCVTLTNKCLTIIFVLLTGELSRLLLDNFQKEKNDNVMQVKIICHVISSKDKSSVKEKVNCVVLLHRSI